MKQSDAHVCTDCTFVCLCVDHSVNILSNLTLSGQTTLGIGLSDSAVNRPYCSLTAVVQVNAHLYKVWAISLSLMSAAWHRRRPGKHQVLLKSGGNYTSWKKKWVAPTKTVFDGRKCVLVEVYQTQTLIRRASDSNQIENLHKDSS